MIITCTSCLTKFHLDDSKVSAKGIKVRCSRCKHVFHFAPPSESKEEFEKDFESFVKDHEEEVKLGTRDEEVLSFLQEEEGTPPEGAKKTPGREEEHLFQEEALLPKETAPPQDEEADDASFKPIRKERRRPSLFFLVMVVLLLLVFGAFYLWSEMGSGGRLAPVIDYPMKQLAKVWERIGGSEKEGLIVKDLNGFEEKSAGASLYVIEGTVHNQSPSTKKFVRVKVTIFDGSRSKVGEKETLCGSLSGRTELKRPPDPVKAEGARPQAEGDYILPSGKTAPFEVVFKDPLGPPKEFEVEIVSAPNL